MIIKKEWQIAQYRRNCEMKFKSWNWFGNRKIIFQLKFFQLFSLTTLNLSVVSRSWSQSIRDEDATTTLRWNWMARKKINFNKYFSPNFQLFFRMVSQSYTFNFSTFHFTSWTRGLFPCCRWANKKYEKVFLIFTISHWFSQ